MKEELYGTRLYINCAQLQSNINYLEKILNESEIIAMIKANAYGFGDILIAKKLEELGINYFGVADFEEGVRLRDNGINSKIMVMNTSKSSIPMLINYKLEPAIYSMELLNEMIRQAGTLLTNKKPYPIHILQIFVPVQEERSPSSTQNYKKSIRIYTSHSATDIPI